MQSRKEDVIDLPVSLEGDPKRSRIKRGLAFLREAVAGSSQDFTECSIGRAIFLLATPMVLEMMMESLFGIINVFWVAHLGAEATATVGLTESLLTLVFAVALGLSTATTATVARRIGEKDHAGASVAAFQSIILGVLASIPVAVISITFAPQIFHLMDASSAVTQLGSGYARIILGGNIVIMELFLINAVFRGAGDASIAMRVLWIANVINIVLDPCLIFGLGPFPKLGVTGSAIATTIGRGTGVLIQLWFLFSGTRRIKIDWRYARIDFAVMARMIRISLGGMFQYLVATASWVGLMRMVAMFGDAALAGYTVALRIIVFALLPSWGMSNAAATLVGQNLGAKKPDRAERSVWVTGFANTCFLGIVTVIFIIFAERLVGIFTTDPAVVPYGTSALRLISYGYIFYAYGMVMVQSFNGAGDTNTPTVINLCCYWLFQIPLAYSLAVGFDFGAKGVFVAITISESALAVVAILVFRRGKWKTLEV
ncbi:MAG TPA: MATE family efflux transporter [Blastocatellia bacterium]|nr:MATE family efflux transporter [Blastocatellia bacterium]